MKKTRRHNFVHQDPENAPTPNTEGKKKTTAAKNTAKETNFSNKDLKRALAGIIASTTILIILYLLNLKFDLLQSLNDLLKF